MEFLGVDRWIAGRSCHHVRVALQRPPASAVLQLAWPVQHEGHSASPQFDNGVLQLRLRLPKAPVWPCDDEPSVVRKMHIERLRLATYDEVGKAMGRMFSLREAAVKSERGRRGSLGAPGTAARVLFDVKETIQSVMMITLQQGGSLLHSLFDAGSAPPGEADITVAVHSVRVMPSGRPLAHLSYVDHALAARMNPTHAQQQRACARFQRVLHSLCGAPGVTTKCARGELGVLRTLLARNAQRLAAPAWQSALLGEGSEWVASFLMPLYTGEDATRPFALQKPRAPNPC